MSESKIQSKEVTKAMRRMRDATLKAVISRSASSPFPYFWKYRASQDPGLVLRKVAQSNLRREAERLERAEASKAQLQAVAS